ncbi:Uncharacterized protein dnl_19390 [Desulfonema limicola]|uniref:Uncharacterized protein n=1 Tax=Desulfonema limicola TaxID=45656 RepID=A0A975GFW3_9BACT|nr:Uncharacterized protein dnl_19390 [Desulfonema limicola]
MICYCFNYTREDIDVFIISAGQWTGFQNRIKLKIKYYETAPYGQNKK